MEAHMAWSADQSHTENYYSANNCCIPLQYPQRDVDFDHVYKKEHNETKYWKKHNPENDGPLSHDLSIDDKFLHNTSVQLGELKSKEVGSSPDGIVSEHTAFRVRLARHPVWDEFTLKLTESL